jgi:hypothetical protein
MPGTIPRRKNSVKLASLPHVVMPLSMMELYLHSTPRTPVWHNAELLVIKNSDNFIFESNSLPLVRERTIPTQRPPHVGEVSANFCV